MLDRLDDHRPQDRFSSGPFTSIATCALAYIAYEVNIKYLTEGRLDIWLNGYGGVDNNLAGLMLAVGVPLSLFVLGRHEAVVSMDLPGLRSAQSFTR